MFNAYRQLVLRRFQYDVFIGKFGSVPNVALMVTMEVSAIFGLMAFVFILLLEAFGRSAIHDFLGLLPQSLALRVALTGVPLLVINHVLIHHVIGLEWLEKRVSETPASLMPEVRRKGIRDIAVPLGAFVLLAFVLILRMP